MSFLFLAGCDSAEAKPGSCSIPGAMVKELKNNAFRIPAWGAYCMHADKPGQTHNGEESQAKPRTVKGKSYSKVGRRPSSGSGRASGSALLQSLFIFCPAQLCSHPPNNFFKHNYIKRQRLPYGPSVTPTQPATSPTTGKASSLPQPQPQSWLTRVSRTCLRVSACNICAARRQYLRPADNARSRSAEIQRAQTDSSQARSSPTTMRPPTPSTT